MSREEPRYPFMYSEIHIPITPFIGHVKEYDLYAHSMVPEDGPETGWLVLTKGRRTLGAHGARTEPRPRELRIWKDSTGWHIDRSQSFGHARDRIEEDNIALKMFIKWFGAETDGVGDALERLG